MNCSIQCFTVIPWNWNTHIKEKKLQTTDNPFEFLCKETDKVKWMAPSWWWSALIPSQENLKWCLFNMFQPSSNADKDNIRSSTHQKIIELLDAESRRCMHSVVFFVHYSYWKILKCPKRKSIDLAHYLDFSKLNYFCINSSFYKRPDLLKASLCPSN